MRPIAALLSLAFLLAACGMGDDIPPRVDYSATVPKEAGPDPSYKPFPHDDPKVVTLPSGVKILDQKVGGPSTKVLKLDQEIKVHYAGWLENGKLFDASYKTAHDKPVTFSIQKGALIEGWLDGMPGLREGGSRLIWIPWERAYGEQGRPPSIPGRSNLVFQVWLWEVVRDLPKAPEPGAPPAPLDVDAADHAGHEHGDGKK